MQSLIVASLFGAATLAAPVHDWWNPLEQEPGYGPYDSPSVNVAVGSRYQETKIALYCDGPGYTNNCITQAYSIQQCTPVEPSFRNKIISFSADYQICTLFDGDDCTGYTQPVYASESNLYYFPKANSYRCYPLGGYSPDAHWVAPPVRTHWVTETQTDTVYLGQPTAISPQATPSPSFPSLSNGHRIHWVTEIITETEYLKQPAATSTPAANPHGEHVLITAEPCFVNIIIQTATSPFQHAVHPLASNQVNANRASPSAFSTPSSSTALPQVSSKAPILPSAGQLSPSTTLPLHAALPDLPVAIGGLSGPGNSPDGPLSGSHGVPPAVPPAVANPGNADVPHPVPGVASGPIGPPSVPFQQKPSSAPYPIPLPQLPNPFSPSPDGPNFHNGPSSQSSLAGPPSPFIPPNSSPFPPPNSPPFGPNGLLSPGSPVPPTGPPSSAGPSPNLQPAPFGVPWSPLPPNFSPVPGSPSGPSPNLPAAPLLGLAPNAVTNAVANGNSASLPLGLVSPPNQSTNPSVVSAPASPSLQSNTLGASQTGTPPALNDASRLPLLLPNGPLGDGPLVANAPSQTKAPLIPIEASIPSPQSPSSNHNDGTPVINVPSEHGSPLAPSAGVVDSSPSVSTSSPLEHDASVLNGPTDSVPAGTALATSGPTSSPDLSSPGVATPSSVTLESPSSTNGAPTLETPLGLVPLLGSLGSTSPGSATLPPTLASSSTPETPLLSFPTPAPLAASPTTASPPLITEPPTTTETETGTATHYDETTTEEETIYRTEFAPEPTSAVDDIDMEEDDEVTPTITEAPAPTPTAADADSSDDEKAETTEEEVEYVTSTARPVHVRLPWRPKPKAKPKKP
ncbi:hypothetical protein ONZ45_g1803 [Pleurotus djamor]|nr:hypothetical protein ONZ45_g1803 [Pleurotus djamor]